MKWHRLIIIVALLFSTTAFGQRYRRQEPLRRFAYGAKIGMCITNMRLTEECYKIYDYQLVPYPALGAWFQYRSESGLVFRPELTLCGRGSQISCHDVMYRVSSACMNLRMNLQLHMYLPRTFMSIYFVAAPSWNVTLGGYALFSSEDTPPVRMNLSSSSMHVHDMNVFVSMGFETPIFAIGRTLYLSGEAGYSFCLTNSFTEAELTNNVTVLNNLLFSHPNMGSRIFSGIEASVRIGIPFGKKIRIRR